MKSTAYLRPGESMNPLSTIDRRAATNAFWPEWWHRRTWDMMTRRILAESDRLATRSNAELQRMAETCRGRVTLCGFEQNVIIDVFALVREIADRVYGLRHHPVQVLGALAMSHGWIAEMGTGFACDPVRDFCVRVHRACPIRGDTQLISSARRTRDCD